MGSLAAQDMVDQSGADSDIALAWHLQSNHYPPLPAELVPVARRVIDKANRGQYDARVRLPEGVSYRGRRLAPVWAAIEAWHLDAFLDHEDDGEEW